jgi:hypothetical protein
MPTGDLLQFHVVVGIELKKCHHDYKPRLPQSAHFWFSGILSRASSRLRNLA